MVCRTASDVKVATGLGSSLALFTVLLAIVGLRSLVAYGVQGRTREFGIRMALGSARGAVRVGVLGRTLRLAAIGLAGAFFASRAPGSLLFGVSPTDPASYLLAAFVILGVAVLSSDGPARRAGTVDPLRALRAE